MRVYEVDINPYQPYKLYQLFAEMQTNDFWILALNSNAIYIGTTRQLEKFNILLFICSQVSLFLLIDADNGLETEVAWLSRV